MHCRDLSSTIYPEIHRGRGVYDSSGFLRRKPNIALAFPDQCPICQAKAVTKTGFSGRKYACNGEYIIKPQIQNHTDVWWGKCGRSNIKE